MLNFIFHFHLEDGKEDKIPPLEKFLLPICFCTFLSSKFQNKIRMIMFFFYFLWILKFFSDLCSCKNVSFKSLFFFSPQHNYGKFSSKTKSKDIFEIRSVLTFASEAVTFNSLLANKCVDHDYTCQKILLVLILLCDF